MLRSIKDMTGYKVITIDGSIASLSGFLFDDKTWLIRYSIAEMPVAGTGSAKKVLIAPFSFGIPDPEHKEFPLTLSRQKIQESPPVDLERPVTRKQQLELYRYYGWPPYDKNPLNSIQLHLHVHNGEEEESIAGSHLINTEETVGYRIEAPDGGAGHVHDFIIDDAVWIIRYIEIDLGERTSGRKVLIFPKVIQEIDRDGAGVVISLMKDTVMNSPEYDESLPIERAYEVKLHQYYGFLRYWD